jgi:hypothetical protein
LISAMTGLINSTVSGGTGVPSSHVKTIGR